MFEDENHTKENHLLVYIRRIQKKRQNLTKRERRNQNAFIGFCLAFIVIALLLLINIGYSIHLKNNLAAEESKVVRQNELLSSQEQQLKRDVKLLKDDDYVLKLARQRFLLSNSGEEIFVISNQDLTGNDAVKYIEPRNKNKIEPPKSSKVNSSIKQSNSIRQ